MAQYNPMLQTAPGVAQPVAQPSATEAIAGVVSGALDMASDYMEGQRKAASLLQKSEAASMAERLAVGWSDRSNNPTKAENWLRAESASLQNLPPELRVEAAATFKKMTGRDLFGSQVDVLKSENESEKIREEMQKRQADDIAYAFRYRSQDPRLSSLFDANGALKPDVNPEDAAAIGRTIRLRDEADLAYWQTQTQIAKSHSERMQANQKLNAATLGKELPAQLVEFASQLEGLPVNDAVQQIERQYEQAVLALQQADISEADKKAIADSMLFAKNNLQSQLTGKGTTAAVSEAEKVRLANDFNVMVNASAPFRVVALLQEAGIRIPDTVAQAGASAATDYYRGVFENPNGNPAPSNIPDTDSPERDKAIANWRRTTANSWVQLANPTKQVETPEQVQAMKTFLATGLSPVTAEQKANFFGRGGIYLQLLEKWRNPEQLGNLGAEVLNSQEVKQGYIRANNEAIEMWIPNLLGNVMGGIENLQDVVNVDTSRGYPQFTLRQDRTTSVGVTGARSSFAGPGSVSVTGQSTRYGAMQKQVDDVNRLLRLQYESAYSYGKAIGEDDTKRADGRSTNDMAWNTVSAQMNAIAMFALVDTQEVSTLKELQ